MKFLLSLTTAFLASIPLISARGRYIYVSGSGSDGVCSDAYTSCSNCNVTWLSVWEEAGLQRYRFTFDGDQLIQNGGQDFLTRIRCHDGNTVANNWQCWGPNKDGTWTFDISELDGAPGAGYVNQGIADVVKKWPNIPG